MMYSWCNNREDMKERSAAMTVDVFENFHADEQLTVGQSVRSDMHSATAEICFAHGEQVPEGQTL